MDTGNKAYHCIAVPYPKSIFHQWAPMQGVIVYLAFFGEDMGFLETEVIPNDDPHWQQPDELAAQTTDQWSRMMIGQRGYDRARVEVVLH